MGRYSGISSAISTIADSLRQGREQKSKLGMLGSLEKIKAQYQPPKPEKASDIANSIKLKIAKNIPLDENEVRYADSAMPFFVIPDELRPKMGVLGEVSSASPYSVGKFNPLRVLPDFAYKGEKKSLIKKPGETKVSASSRQQAINALTKAGYPTTEANIKSALEQMQGG